MRWIIFAKRDFHFIFFAGKKYYDGDDKKDDQGAHRVEGCSTLIKILFQCAMDFVSECVDLYLNFLVRIEIAKVQGFLA